MFAVTEDACVLLTRLMEDPDCPEGSYPRLVMVGDELVGIEMDDVGEDDLVIVYGDRVVLVIDEGLSDRLSDAYLDVEGDEFTLIETTDEGDA